MTPDPERQKARVGAAYALAAFGCWGALPIFFKSLAYVPALELLAQRTVWSLVLLIPLAWIVGRSGDLKAALRSPRARRWLTLSTLLLGINWAIYIWAVNDDRLLETSLGYFINPLVNVALGLAFLGERLRPWQWAAIALASAGVVNEALALGVMPWVSLAIAATFGFYGLVRKTAPIDAISGLAVEVMFLTPLALAYLVWLGATGAGHFLTHDRFTDLMLLISGVVTTVPLLCFNQAARRLKLSTIGLFQYIGPTGHLLLAVFVYGEPMTPGRMISFGLIWAALAIYSIDAARPRAA
jgi:chloramphenicol-sensitive protein RarD